MLLLAIALAVDVLDAPIPRLFIDPIRRDSAIAALVAGVERRLFASVGMRARPYSEWVVPIRAMPTIRGRARFIANRALTPNIDDFNFIALPPAATSALLCDAAPASRVAAKPPAFR